MGLQNKLVLIVDDEERNVFALSRYLETLEMRTKTAKNGEEAINVMRSEPRPDIVLLDMMMPVMDGYETLAVLKKDEVLKNIPVIAVTAKAMVGDKEKCLDAGAWDYIAKPVNIGMLIEKMDRWIE